MPYFKDTEGLLHFLESADFEHLLPVGSVQITAAEASALQNPVPTADRMAADVRTARSPLLLAADIAINIAEDNGRDAGVWRAYRQELRDITAQEGFPKIVKWPSPPK